jgi:hypothetical protein
MGGCSIPPGVALVAVALSLLSWAGGAPVVEAAYVATTSVSLTVCGDALVSGNEFCDDASNTGAY